MLGYEDAPRGFVEGAYEYGDQLSGGNGTSSDSNVYIYEILIIETEFM